MIRFIAEHKDHQVAGPDGGLIPDPDVQARQPRGHLKGVRGRAVPTFDKRRGAVGA